MILCSDVATLTTWTGALLAVEFILVATSALVSRLRNPELDRPYRTAIVAAVADRRDRHVDRRAGVNRFVPDLVVAGACVLLALGYHVLYTSVRAVRPTS